MWKFGEVRLHQSPTLCVDKSLCEVLGSSSFWWGLNIGKNFPRRCVLMVS